MWKGKRRAESLSFPHHHHHRLLRDTLRPPGPNTARLRETPRSCTPGSKSQVSCGTPTSAPASRGESTTSGPRFGCSDRALHLHLGGREWHGIWEDVEQYLEDFFNGLVLEQDPVKVIKYVMEKCCGSSREVQSYATCWALATLYWTLLYTRQQPHGDEEEKRPTGTVAT